MSRIVTFYSYKGGVGRSMALANVAVLLARQGKKVLMVDWDLEAPGLENYFFYFKNEVGGPGLLALLIDAGKGTEVDYRNYLSPIVAEE
ncbi:AAA family ATPase [Bradyrhizobium sp. AUGA SZCCT0158]|uniref:AAA family ATPase n=1 Tax=Bradyrhizobium sp. AUGA SZCCT0158 TaxID=2807661 RepID=UPI001BAA1F39|nr:AAA family ATPase [Bradyrhizobium sp. AUGA SZCCT0158]MBR1199537.1 AAA family ATPase [Bradyrhizobium sp. AUGA SZCCT0158]